MKVDISSVILNESDSDDPRQNTPKPFIQREVTSYDIVRTCFSDIEPIIRKRKISTVDNAFANNAQEQEAVVMDFFAHMLASEENFDNAKLEKFTDVVVELNCWLFKICARYMIFDEIMFVGIYIMYKYLSQPISPPAGDRLYLICGVCLNIANKIQRCNGCIKPSRMIQTEARFMQYTVKDFVDAELCVMQTLEWKFENIRSPHEFIDYFLSTINIHPKIQKTARSCAKKCIISTDFLFLLPSKLGVYCLLASCLHHGHSFYYCEILARYGMSDSNNDEIRNIAHSISSLIVRV